MRQSIPKSDQIKIIKFYKTEKNNSVSEIIKKFGYKKTTINTLLDNYLKPVK
jgi:DNA-binding MarR family transcriptional regulator